jgi:hypothetical protein
MLPTEVLNIMPDDVNSAIYGFIDSSGATTEGDPHTTKMSLKRKWGLLIHILECDGTTKLRGNVVKTPTVSVVAGQATLRWCLETLLDVESIAVVAMLVGPDGGVKLTSREAQKGLQFELAS